MKDLKLPKIGDRVSYHSSSPHWDRKATGIVRAIYPPLPPHSKNKRENWAFGVEVDEIPDWWPYLNTNRFAPRADELTVQS